MRKIDSESPAAALPTTAVPMRLVLRALSYLLILTAVVGGIYPALVLAAAQLFWPDQANGSLITRGGCTIGSSLIAQSFRSSAYVHPRPSAAGGGYDATASGGRNESPSNVELAKAIAAAVAEARLDRPGDPRPVPADLVTCSGSGLDPHVSPEAALWQAARIARARHTTEERVAAVIRLHIERRTLGFLGEPRVNVLRANLDLDRSLPVSP